MYGYGDSQVASDPVTARTIRRHRPSNGGRLCKRGHPSGAPILKPCEFAVKPSVTAGRPRTVKVPGTCTREAGLDRALVKDSVGTYRKDGQDRAPPGL
jgi:hypothetical protein